MKVAVLGLWHLGTVTAACVAGAGIAVVGIDDDAQTIAKLANGEPPLYEPGLAELVGEGLASGRLAFATDPARLEEREVKSNLNQTATNNRCRDMSRGRGKWACDW